LYWIYGIRRETKAEYVDVIYRELTKVSYKVQYLPLPDQRYSRGTRCYCVCVRRQRISI